MFITFAGHQTGAFVFNFNTTLQNPFMIAFFTTVGLGASMSLLKKGGQFLIIYWLIAGIVSIIQNFISVGLAAATHLEYPYALLAGAISMIVPIVWAFLVDIIYQPQTIAFIKFFVKGFVG